jgi:hypothetical protein
MTFQVNMGSRQTFSQITLDANGSTTNFAQSLEVDVSSDGVNWAAVSPAPTIVYQPLQTITFASPVTTQYIQFKLLAGGAHWWSIYEMNAYSNGSGGTSGSGGTTGSTTGSTTGGTTGSTTGSTTGGTTGSTGGSDAGTDSGSGGPGACGNQQTALTRTGWTLTGSDNTSQLSMLIDGNVGTRWTTGRPQQPGEWFQIDLGANPPAYDDITLDSSQEGNDWGRAVTIETSKDGTTWTTLTVTGAPQGGVTALTYNCTQDRYIKVTQQSNTPTNWWSIGEVNVLR